MTFKDDVIFTGRLSTEKLKEVLGAALALTYVPYFEGFGIPIIEAQQSGIAVITSDISSMPEVANGSAHLVNPYDVKSITNGLITLANDSNYRASLIKKGEENIKRFSWDLTAKKVWECMQKSL